MKEIFAVTRQIKTKFKKEKDFKMRSAQVNNRGMPLEQMKTKQCLSADPCLIKTCRQFPLLR